MGSLWWDLRAALRSLARRPGFTLLTTLLLALGIGAGTAVFVLLDTIFVHSLAVPEPERLVRIYRTTADASGAFTGFDNVSHPDFLDLRRRSRLFSDLALYQTLPVSLGATDRAERVRGMYVSASYFGLLGLRPAQGRFFLPEEDAPGSLHPVAVLSHAAWERLLTADPGAVGRTLTLNGRSFEIVGIAPRGFNGTDFSTAADIWIPLPFFRMTGYGQNMDERGFTLFACLGKLETAGKAQAAGEELAAIARQLSAEYPGTDADRSFTTLPLLATNLPPRDRERYASFGRTLTVCFGLVLLLVCVSLGGLLLIRGLGTLGDRTIRQALGAGRWQALRPHLCESLLVFVLGGLASVPVSLWALDLLWRLRPPELLYARPDFGLGTAAIGCTLLLTFSTCLLFALLPAIWHFRPAPSAVLRAPSLLSRRYRRLLDIPVAAQVALALVALIGSGLFLQSLRVARRVDLGFDPGHMAVATVAPGDQGYDEPRGRSFYRALLERVRSLPGARFATLSENRLLRGAILRNEIYRDGDEEPALSGEQSQHRVNVVVPGFFRTAGISLRAGRDFSEADCQTCPPVAIINQTMADTLWPGQEATGKRIHLVSSNAPPVEVVGVAEDLRYRAVFEKPQFFVYLPLTQVYASTMTLHVRTSGDPEALLPAVRREVAALDPQMPLADAASMEHFVDEALWFERTSALLLGALSGLSLVLALLGVYSAAALSVAFRSREMAVRMALGATRGGLQWTVLRETGLVVGAGIAAGWLLAFFGLRNVIAEQLHATDAGSLLVYAGQALLLLAAGLLGGFLSSRRIARIEPAVVLKEV